MSRDLCGQTKNKNTKETMCSLPEHYSVMLNLSPGLDNCGWITGITVAVFCGWITNHDPTSLTYWYIYQFNSQIKPSVHNFLSPLTKSKL